MGLGVALIILPAFILIFWLLTKSAQRAMWRGEKEYYEATGKLQSEPLASNFNPDYPERVDGYKHGYDDFGPRTMEALTREYDPSKVPSWLYDSGPGTQEAYRRELNLSKCPSRKYDNAPEAKNSDDINKEGE